MTDSPTTRPSLLVRLVALVLLVQRGQPVARLDLLDQPGRRVRSGM